LKQISGKELAKAVQRDGWTLVCVKGSHYIFTKPNRRERMVIPNHSNQPLKIDLLRSLMKIAELTEEEI